MSPSDSGPRASRPFIGIQWECCGTYTRVYRHVSGEYYQGRCPRCGKTARLKVEPGGTNSRFFRVR
jgi:hypothetical protein